jgi:hypothetical protein
MRVVAFLATLTVLAGCAESDTAKRPSVSVGHLAAYTADADLPLYSTADLELGRAEEILGAGEDQATPLRRTQFETKAEFEARVSKLLEEWSAPVGGKGQFVISVPAHQTYDIDTKTSSFCVLDSLMHDCLLPKSNSSTHVVLKFSSIALPSVGVTRELRIAFDKPQATTPVPIRIQIEPKVAEQIADSARLAFVFSLPRPFADEGPIRERSSRRGREIYSVDDINVKLHRVVIYQPGGGVLGAKSYE